MATKGRVGIHPSLGICGFVREFDGMMTSRAGRPVYNNAADDVGSGARVCVREDPKLVVPSTGLERQSLAAVTSIQMWWT